MVSKQEQMASFAPPATPTAAHDRAALGADNVWDRGGWRQLTVGITGPGGAHLVRGLVHPAAPGLAVTENPSVGWFTVTHTATGRKVAGPYERAANGMLALAQLSRLANWTAPDGATISAEITAHGDEPAGIPDCTVTSGGVTRPMTKREVFDFVRATWLSEFPWEESAPECAAAKILNAAEVGNG